MPEDSPQEVKGVMEVMVVSVTTAAVGAAVAMQEP